MNRLVITRWDEDLDWVSDVPRLWYVDVVQKGKHCPDMGKEAGGYLWWLWKWYDTVCSGDTVCFAQADPFDHVPDFISQLRPVDRFTPLGVIASSNPDGEPFDLKREWLSNLGEDFPGHPVEFPVGACFIVPGAAVRARRRSDYERLYHYVMQTPEYHSHVLERMWPGIFA